MKSQEQLGGNMAEFKLKIAVWYLKMVRTEIQETIAILCQKDILSKVNPDVVVSCNFLKKYLQQRY